MKKAKDELLFLANLNWLPWIGKDYFSSDSRVLIVGESHYLLPKDDKYYEKNKEEVKRSNFTRNVVQTFCVDNYKPQPTFDNLTRCLFGERDIKNISVEKRKEKWKHLAFYNFVQHPMETNQKRPTKKDIREGWSVFVDLIKILRPTKCIFIGVAAADSSYNPYQCHCSKKNQVGKVKARLFTAQIDEHTPVSCIAIKHTSQYFSWKKWYDILTTFLN